MPVPATASAELQSSLRELSLSENGPIKDIARPTQTTSTSKKNAVAESWEDELDDSESGSDGDAAQKQTQMQMQTPQRRKDGPPPRSPSLSAEGPLDPPPTPISPQISQAWGMRGMGESGSLSSSPGNRTPTSAAPAPGRDRDRETERRPEKQTAVAGRMIAGALGVRAPKRTPEQREYDRSVKEQEIRRRNLEREQAAKAKEEEEWAKAAMWDD